MTGTDDAASSGAPPLARRHGEGPSVTPSVEAATETSSAPASLTMFPDVAASSRVAIPSAETSAATGSRMMLHMGDGGFASSRDATTDASTSAESASFAMLHDADAFFTPSRAATASASSSAALVSRVMLHDVDVGLFSSRGATEEAATSGAPNSLATLPDTDASVVTPASLPSRSATTDASAANELPSLSALQDTGASVTRTSRAPARPASETEGTGRPPSPSPATCGKPDVESSTRGTDSVANRDSPGRSASSGARSPGDAGMTTSVPRGGVGAVLG